MGVEPASGLPDDGLLVGTLALRMFAIHDLARTGCVRPATEARTICDRLRPATGQLVMYAGGIGVWGSVDLFLAMALLAVAEAGELIRQADAALLAARLPASAASV